MREWTIGWIGGVLIFAIFCALMFGLCVRITNENTAVRIQRAKSCASAIDVPLCLKVNR